MKTPVKIVDKKSKNDLIELSFSFPWEEKLIFKNQITNFWESFTERNKKIDGCILQVAQHIQSATSLDAQLTPYMNKKKSLIDNLSSEINNFINLHEKEQRNTLIQIPKVIRHDLNEALRLYNHNANLLKDAYKFEHLYLKEMIDNFGKVKRAASQIFERYEFISEKVNDLQDVYQATLRVCFGTRVEVEECVIKDHKDFKHMKINSSVIEFVSNCLQEIIRTEFESLDTKAQEQFKTFIFDKDFILDFKNQNISVEDYINQYQKTIKIQQEFLESSDYRESTYSKSSFMSEKSTVIDESLLNLWHAFSSHYEKILNFVNNDPVIVTNLKKQILTLSLKDFFSLDKVQILAQALSDVSVDDFASRYPFLTWKIFSQENYDFCEQFKKTFYQKYANKFNLEILKRGVFFQEFEGEFQLTFITFDSENLDSLNLFLKKIETKYQKKWNQIKSVKTQKLGDMLDISQNNQKIVMPVQYYFFTFRDPGLLQNLKTLMVA